MKVTVRARGTYGCSGWPVMKLYVNGTLRGTWTVSSTSYADYTSPPSTPVTANAQVEVVFSNACTRRTLQVDVVTIPTMLGPRPVQAEGSGTVYDRGEENGGAGGSAFDGVNVVDGADALAAGYDLNGNMTLRLKDGARYYLSYDAENRLVGVSGAVTATFGYNGDGQRVTANIGGLTTYIGNYFEWKSGAGTQYYYAGAIRIAMRTGAGFGVLVG